MITSRVAAIESCICLYPIWIDSTAADIPLDNSCDCANVFRVSLGSSTFGQTGMFLRGREAPCSDQQILSGTTLGSPLGSFGSSFILAPPTCSTAFPDVKCSKLRPILGQPPNEMISLVDCVNDDASLFVCRLTILLSKEMTCTIF